MDGRVRRLRAPDDLDSWGDYGRACQIDGHAGCLETGHGQALVLADEPASTTYLPERQLSVRWICADSEDDVIRLVPRAVETADWEEAGIWTTSGPAQLFDSAYAGDELDDEQPLAVDTARVARTWFERPASSRRKERRWCSSSSIEQTSHV